MIMSLQVGVSGDGNGNGSGTERGREEGIAIEKQTSFPCGGGTDLTATTAYYRTSLCLLHSSPKHWAYRDNQIDKHHL